MIYNITFPGCAIVKKNSATTSYMYKDKKSGQVKVRQSNTGAFAPIHYYSKAYKEWAKNAVQACIVYKSKHPEIKFPLNKQYNLKMLFYYNVNRKVDLSALIEGVADVLAGNEKWLNLSYDWSIIEDDSTRFIQSYDGSRVILEYVNPRTEIFLEEV